MIRAGAYRRFARAETGTTMVELAISISLFLLILLGAIDFARFYFHFTAAEKGLAIAARTASVRPAICPQVPDINMRGPAAGTALTPDYGATCQGALLDQDGNVVSGTICAQVSRSCLLSETAGATATADELWSRLRAVLPPNATRDNIRVSYGFDPAINFLGGPYVPNVAVEITGLEFQFISPIGPLASMAGAATATFDQSPPFPSLRAMAPGEDLAAGNDG